MATTLEAEFLVLCDQAIISKEGKLSIIGIFNQIFVRRLPTRFSQMFIVTVFSGSPGKDYSLILEIKNSQNKVVEKRSVKLKLGANGKANFIAHIHGLPIESVGNFSLSFKKDSRKIISKQLQIIQVKPSANQSTLPN